MASEPARRTVAYVAPNDVEIRQRPALEPGAEDVLVRVTASGVCGTDVDIFRGATPVAAGRVLGHEGAGVVEVAPATSGLEPGMPVVVDPTLACGACALCLEGLPNLCPSGGLLGRELDGVFTDEVAMPASNVHRLPDGIALGDAPMIQVLATIVHAQDRVPIVPARPAVVVGLGCTGQLHAQLLRHRGARVFGVTRSPSKLELARRLACDRVAPPDKLIDLAAELGDLGGADLVVEAAGTLDALEIALRLVRPGGTVLAYGSQTAVEGRLSFYTFYRKEIALLGSRANLPRDFPTAIALVSSRAVELGPLVDERFPLDQAATALERAASGTALKVLMMH
ncbi:MAG: hypothetical protein C5B48_07275 [Candidatus Rokuibacteriota bacterium]|nr:MAG: hypothetical protein C5B48_07275 [Candidatus Rokubacteria bacterium]